MLEPRAPGRAGLSRGSLDSEGAAGRDPSSVLQQETSDQLSVQCFFHSLWKQTQGQFLKAVPVGERSDLSLVGSDRVAVGLLGELGGGKKAGVRMATSSCPTPLPEGRDRDTKNGQEEF
ncbi:hypothetical protein EK904_006944 [Melospiza melodia maxima]|nr:hypothetical protein EK904_006944 [Melospiza melodia maxima]